MNEEADILARIGRGESIEHFETIRVRKDGVAIDVSVTISAIRDDRGVITGVSKVARDITERKRAEAALQEQARILDLAQVIVRDMNSRIVFWSSGAEKLYGYGREDAIGQVSHTLLQTEFPGSVVDAEETLLRDGSWEGELTHHTKNGSVVVVASVWVLHREAGVPLRILESNTDITPRKLAEKAVQQSDARKKFALETAGIGDWELNLSTMHATRSALHDKIFGHRELHSEWSFDVFLKYVHPDDRTAVVNTFRTSVSERTRWEFECRINRADGELRWIWACGGHYWENHGGSARVFGIVQDVTELHQATEALRESEQRFQAMANGIPQLAWMAEPDGSIFWYNERWYEYTGTTFEQMQGWAWESVHDPEVLPRVLKRWKSAIAGGEIFDMEFPLRRADGVFRTFLTRVLPLKDSEGHVVRWFGTNTDISERKQTEEQLARQARELASSRDALESQTVLLRSVLDSIGEGLIAADPRGNFLLWNPAAEKIVGMGAAAVPPEEWSKHFGAFMPDTVTPFPLERNPLALALRGEASTAEMYLRNPKLTQGVWIESSGRPLKGADGVQRGGVIALRDVTEKRAAEREIIKLNAELEQRVVERTAELEEANKELESFTYSVAHDLRAPLRHIAGYSGMLLEEFGDEVGDEVKRHLCKIQNGTHKMGELVDELLTLAQVGRTSPAFRMADLNSMVQEVIDILQPETKDRLVEWRIADLPCVECDATLLKQVFQNLIANALKYSRPRPVAIIEIGQMRESEQSAIFVRDNGVGFNMKYVNKLFGVFQRLHRAEDFEGTGVGLATVQRIIKKHHGRVWAEAELDKGATFYFTIGESQVIATNKDKMAVGA